MFDANRSRVFTQGLYLLLMVALAAGLSLPLTSTGAAVADGRPPAGEPAHTAPAAPGNPVTHPAGNTHTAPLTTTVSITYDEPINPTTVSTRTFAVHAMETGLLAQTYNVQGGVISLTPPQPFKPGELVQVSATTGTLNITNEQPISSTIWQFRAAVPGGSGLFADSGQSLGSSQSKGVALGDLDGDGDIDAFVANDNQPDKVWRNDGTGAFHDSGQSLSSCKSRGVALGDLDGDGDLDAFVANDNQPNKVWRNDGTGSFSGGQWLGSASSTGVALGDLDGDGDLDAFVANHSGGANKVWLNDGTGTFSDSGQSMTSAKSYELALGDLDGDGDIDAFVANDGANKVWLNDGMGVFSDSGQSLGSSTSYGMALGDVDGDGDLDAFIGNGGANKVWLNDGTGTFSDSGQSLGSAWSETVSLRDVDGDGDLDAFVVNFNGTDQVWWNDGTGAFSDSGQVLGSASSWAVALGDVDGDGDLDAFLGTPYGGGANKVWLNQNQADLSISKIVNSGAAAPGQTITYILVYANHGPQAAAGILITDVVPIALTNVGYISSGATITPTGSVSYTWQVADLSLGEGGVITITGVFSGSLPAGHVFTNTATIAASTPESDTGNNSSSAAVTVSEPPFYFIYLPLALRNS